ncbi:MAG: outer membrane protein assembly factor BamD [Verrucomicrobia bacterium]|nr:outer membrane protein assembly factor BamD [Verrucomicrobiota bacterium]
MKRSIVFFILISTSCFASLTLRDGKLVQKEEAATQPVQEHYSSLMQAYETQDWKTLEKEAIVVSKSFPDTPFGKDALYFLGVAYFKQEDFEMANRHFKEYLTKEATPKHFEEAIRYKFEIADQFRNGAHKHLFGLKSMPKWAPADDEALQIYDEVISALPHNELAAKALYGKAKLQAKGEDYRAAIETYQTLIRRFNKHPLAVESYIGIGEIYLDQSKTEYPDPDFLDLAALNLRKFQTSFPGEEKIAVANENFHKMEDRYAASFYETAQFYERTKKWGAAKIYYTKILASFPESHLADRSRSRLEVVTVKAAEIDSKKASK